MSSTRVSESRINLRSSVRKLSSSPRLLGHNLRRLGKSTMSLTAHRSESRTGKRLKLNPSVEEEAGPCTYITSSRKVEMAAYYRMDRKTHGELFQTYYIYDASFDRKVYINSSGITNSWEDKSTGHQWVAVYGVRSICVVWKGDLELKRFPHSTQISNVRQLFALNVISELEDIKWSTEDSRQTLDKPVKKPFAVVCLTPSTTDVHQERGDEVIEDSGAVNYLKEKLKSGSDFDHTETIQTAISALQHQCNQKFTADDIWVCVLQGGSDICLKGKEIEEHLAEINTPSTKPLQTEEQAVAEAHLQTSEIEERAYTVVEAPVQTNEVETKESRSDTIVGVPSQTTEMEELNI